MKNLGEVFLTNDTVYGMCHKQNIATLNVIQFVFFILCILSIIRYYKSARFYYTKQLYTDIILNLLVII